MKQFTVLVLVLEAVGLLFGPSITSKPPIIKDAAAARKKKGGWLFLAVWILQEE